MIRCDARDIRVWDYHRVFDVTPVIEMHHRVMSHLITPTCHLLPHPVKSKLPRLKLREFLLGKKVFGRLKFSDW